MGGSYMHYALLTPTRSGYADHVDTAAGAASSTAMTVADADTSHITKTELFLLSVGAGITVWGVTRFLTHFFKGE